jgi:large subunit ribosomal protein L9
MSQVKLILIESVHNLGEAGDLVNVKPGFARNFLLPQGKAILATDSKVKELEHKQRVVAERVAREMKDLEASKKKLESLTLRASARAGEEGKLFGSVTTAQIAELLAEQGFEIDRRRIELGEPIKEVGDHQIPIKLHREVVASVKLSVTAEGGPPPGHDEDEREESDFDDRRERNRDDEEDDD